MRSSTSLALSCGITVLLALAGCATDPSAPSRESTAPAAAPATAPAPSASSPAPLREIPRLKVVMACGACTVPDTVPGLIIQGYAEAAAKSGAKISSQSEATLSITDYSQRPPGARAMVGALAGKDEIKAVVMYGASKFEVEDYYRNAWQGMNSLAQKIGAMTFEKLKR